MPAKVHDAIARQWELIKTLPSRGPGKSSRELAQILEENGFSVTKRTVERDLNELQGLFPIECNDKSKPYGWRWMQDAFFDLPGLTLADALSTQLLEEFLKQLLPLSIQRTLIPRFKLATRKLEALGENPAKSWTKKVKVVLPSIHLVPPNIDPQILETMQEALLHDVQLEISYHTLGNESANALTLHPLGLVQRGPATYLVATAFDYDDVRLYAVHRIISAVKNRKASHRPVDFSLDQYIAQGALDFGNGDYIKLKASVSGSLAQILLETPLSEDMKITEKGGKFMLSCTVVDSWQLHWWILSQGDGIEVLAPESLRAAVIDSIRAIGSVYGL